MNFRADFLQRPGGGVIVKATKIAAPGRSRGERISIDTSLGICLIVCTFLPIAEKISPRGCGVISCVLYGNL